MKSLNVLVVEDEVLIAQIISIYLNERGHTMIGNPISYEDAIHAIELHQPDIVLLDIRLYGQKSGIDLAEYLINNHPTIPFVFLTSLYDKNNLTKVFAKNPSGYLTKPIQKESFWTTIELAYNRSNNQYSGRNIIHLVDGRKTKSIDQSRIVYIQSNHVYLDIFFDDNSKITVRNSIGNMIKSLNQNSFIQCHRSYIINTSFLEEWDNVHSIVRGIKIPISRSKRNQFNRHVLNTFAK